MPDFERFDEVLFRLAQCLSFAGRYAEARPHLARLQAEFSESPYVEQGKKLESSFPPPGVAPATPPGAPAPPKNPAEPPKTSPPGGR